MWWFGTTSRDGIVQRAPLAVPRPYTCFNTEHFQHSLFDM